MEMDLSEIMRRVKPQDTRPELALRKALWHLGFRYWTCCKWLPGKPDIVFRGVRTVVFVHGCFWHGHAGCKRHRIPKTNSEWWIAKFMKNQNRDAEVEKRLNQLGWTVVVVWECEIDSKLKLERVVGKLAGILR